MPNQMDPARATCNGTRKDGSRCTRLPNHGSPVCSQHGGNTAQVKRKAQLRLAALVDPAILTIARVMTDPTASHGDKLKAANSVLDRAGLGRQPELIDLATAQAFLMERLIEARVKVNLPVPDEEALQEIMAAQPDPRLL